MPARKVGPLEAATKAEIVKLTNANAADAAAVLILARRLDETSEESVGSAVAALHKQWLAGMGALRAVSKPKADPVDELQRRRDARQARAREK